MDLINNELNGRECFDEHEFDDYEYLAHEGERQSEPDPYFIRAKKDIAELYENDKESVYYMRQLQVKYERKYYHWITRTAVTRLEKEGYLKQINVSQDAGGNPLKFHFFVHHRNRYPKRNINALARLVGEYSQDHIMLGCGNRAEILFAEGLASRRFVPIRKKVAEYNGKKWVKSKHDLDYIFSKDNIDYGCEIKNTLGYIEKEELEVKLEMCGFFNVRPLFIMRYSPKTYNDMIINANGFALLFKAQIYEISQRDLVERIRRELGYEVDCPKAIPSGIIDRFEKWHNKQKPREL